MPGAVLDRHRRNVRGLSRWISRSPGGGAKLEKEMNHSRGKEEDKEK